MSGAQTESVEDVKQRYWDWMQEQAEAEAVSGQAGLLAADEATTGVPDEETVRLAELFLARSKAFRSCADHLIAPDPQPDQCGGSGEGR